VKENSGTSNPQGRSARNQEDSMKSYSEGTKVQWNWGDGTGTGHIKTVYTEKVTRKIKGAEVTRKATKSDPAYYIEQEDGDSVLKSHSELKKIDD
tara:strand:- start:525 stop:809 length:285 start_codon:yes stop_codon:yes gene_type:complete